MFRKKQKGAHKPSDKEKCQKIAQAQDALTNNRIVFIDERHRYDEYEFLDVNSAEELLEWIDVFLKEIEAIGPVECFVGKTAPRCNHPGYEDVFLFAYAWDSSALGERVYLKFGMRNSKEQEGTFFYYCHLDCHEDRPRQ